MGTGCVSGSPTPRGRPARWDQLRDATLRALQSLLANAKRMLRSASGEMSRRKDLLRLAAWFDAAGPDEAHDLAVAAFGLYGARHLGVAPEPDLSVPAYVSWWTGPAVDVPVALRERAAGLCADAPRRSRTTPSRSDA